MSGFWLVEATANFWNGSIAASKASASSILSNVVRKLM
jgi:hypothetical protein